MAFLPNNSALESGGPTWVRIVHETPGETDVSICRRRRAAIEERDNQEWLSHLQAVC